MAEQLTPDLCVIGAGSGGSTGVMPKGADVRIACARLPAAIIAFDGTHP